AGHAWVAASGIRDIKRLRVEDIGGGDRPYTVRLHFSEPEALAPGARVFDVLLQGRQVEQGLDVARAAGGRRRALVREYRGVLPGDTLTVDFVKPDGAAHGPVLAGLEITAE
ncbi:MAG: malectin domain-containing carbohydrate-binding protein, partial [Kiritimatiellia bacterium]